MITHNRSFAIGTVALFSLLIAISLFTWWNQAQVWQDQVIDEHIKELYQAFKRIDADCHILGFDHQKNYIDFLNVVTFVGSEVGSMNLAHPENWKGPYLKDNPTMQEQAYNIVRTHKGYYIVPGDGVVLSNGKVIGKDIIFGEDADIDAMLGNEEQLKFKDYLLAVRLPLHEHTATSDLTPREKLVIKEDSGI